MNPPYHHIHEDKIPVCYKNCITHPIDLSVSDRYTWNHKNREVWQEFLC